MQGKPVCGLHGGKGGEPKGERNGAYRTGRYTAEAKAERRQMRAVIRELRRLDRFQRVGLRPLSSEHFSVDGTQIGDLGLDEELQAE
jgi:hypothetical protein